MKRIAFLAGLLLSFSTQADITLSPVPVGTPSVVTQCIPVYDKDDANIRIETITSATSGLVIEAKVGNLPIFTYSQAGGTLAPISDVLEALQEDIGGGPSYVNETTDINDAGTNDVSFPATPANGDAILVGYNGPFNGFTINVGTALNDASGNMITWRYWDGGSWEEVSGLVDGTSDLENAGSNDVTWLIPSDWAAVNIDSQGANFYIRIEIDGNPSVTDPLITEVDIYLGNYNTPDAGDVRIESDAAGCIELHFADAIWASIGSKTVSIYITDVQNTIMDAMGIVSQDAINADVFVDLIYEEVGADHIVVGTMGAQIETKIDNIETNVATAQADLDIITGSDGTTLATAQGNYAPSTVAALATAQNDLDTITSTGGVFLDAAGLNADAANEIRDAIAAKVLETGISWDCALALITAYTSGPWLNSGVGNLTTTYQEPNGAVTRMVHTRDTSVNFRNIDSFTCP